MHLTGRKTFSDSVLNELFIEGARAEFYFVFKQHLKNNLNFEYFSEPVWGPDQLIGTCSSGEIVLKWNHDTYSGFFFYYK